MKYKIVERDNQFAVHSIGYWGDEGKKKAQERIDSGYCKRYWLNKQAEFVVIEDKGWAYQLETRDVMYPARANREADKSIP